MTGGRGSPSKHIQVHAPRELEVQLHILNTPHQVDLGAGVAACAGSLVHAAVLRVELIVGQQRQLAEALLRCADPQADLAAWIMASKTHRSAK